MGREALDGRQAVVLLEREHTPPPIRTRLMAALHEPGRVARAIAVARVVLARHFTAAGEIEVTGFHLRGIPLFGGATDNARWVTGNYARRLGRDAVPVFRVEQGFRARETPDDIIIEYVGQPESKTSYPKREYGIVRVKLAESIFDWRGAATYSAEPAAPSSIVTLEPSA